VADGCTRDGNARPAYVKGFKHWDKATAEAETVTLSMVYQAVILLPLVCWCNVAHYGGVITARAGAKHIWTLQEASFNKVVHMPPLFG